MRTATVLVLAAALVFTACPAFAQGGNKPLMDKWAAEKQAVKDKVYEKLRSEGKLPASGKVEFTACVKPDPAQKGRYLITVERYSVVMDTVPGVTSAPGAVAKAFEPIEIPVEGKSWAFSGDTAVIEDVIEVQGAGVAGGGSSIAKALAGSDAPTGTASGVVGGPAPSGSGNGVTEGKLAPTPSPPPAPSGQGASPPPPSIEEKGFWQRLKEKLSW